MPPTKWSPLPIKEGGTDGTTPFSARRALEISEGASSANMVSVKDFPFGAKGDGVIDDTAAFTTANPFVVVPVGTYLINQNATITSDLFFTGGMITVPTGKTVTITGTVLAASEVIFKGLGTIIIARGIIDCSWFDGTDAASKFAFLARMLTNSNGLTKTVIFPTPASTDAWAALSGTSQWGYGWRVDTPILVTQLVGMTTFLTPAPFIATSSIARMWYMGSGAGKADGWHFPMRLLLDGNTSNCTAMMTIEGGSSWSLNVVEMHNGVNGITVAPTGAGKTVSSFHIKHIICGELNGYGLMLDGSASSANSITDGVIEYCASYGLGTAGANYFIQIQGVVQNLKIGKVMNRATAAAHSDYALAAVFITNANNLAPSLGVEIGYILANSTVNTAKAVVIGDSSGGSAPKISGVTLRGGLSPTAPAFSVDWCTDINIENVDDNATITVGANASETYIRGCNPAIVTDSGTRTRIEGRTVQGTTVASANNLVLGTNANYFQISGNTQINLLANTNWQGGSFVTLKFNSTPTVKHNQATSGANVKIILNGAVDFVAAASNTLTLRYDSTDVAWYEQSRKV